MFAVSSQTLAIVSRAISIVATSPRFVLCSLAVAATEASLGLLSELELDDSVVAMLKDDVPEIRRKVVADGVATLSAKKTVDQFGEDVLSQLNECVQDKQWRVRAAFIDQLPVITAKMVRAC